VFANLCLFSIEKFILVRIFLNNRDDETGTNAINKLMNFFEVRVKTVRYTLNNHHNYVDSTVVAVTGMIDPSTKNNPS
jgi:hypothetical protein